MISKLNYLEQFNALLVNGKASLLSYRLKIFS